jgi:hypothetical protein
MASKGKRKPTIRDLSRQSPTAEEARALRDAFYEGAPMVTAILGLATIEIPLEELLRKRFKHKDDSTWGRLIGENGPLSTFSQKIIAGYAFGLYGENTLRNLNIVRDVRNVFAHSKRLIDFNDAVIVERLKEAKLPKAKHSEVAKLIRKARMPKLSGYSSYICLCTALYIELIGRMSRGHVAAARNYKRVAKKFRMSPLASLFAPPPDGIAGFGGLPALYQSADPTTQAQVTSPLNYLAKFATPPRSKDKSD